MNNRITKRAALFVALIAPVIAFSSPAEETHSQTVIKKFSNLALALSAESQIGKTLYYDPAYVSLSYPGGDVPLERGVCTDVVIRALRTQHADLQQLVHQDMKLNFSIYPRIWGLKKTDTNIDHRRVPNLETYFKRHKMSRPITSNIKDYLPGDIVSWRLDNGLPHIGIVAARTTQDGRPLVVHNIGAGTQAEDVLFAWPINGHYRYFGE